ncbi:MAG: tRNA lysidine(34) synthetase TilS, partial [Deltaproteobacteria bacterium]|nr:tRNA lysidine(34) synthetase TilS [Deltaproteobacteria bacterium]
APALRRTAEQARLDNDFLELCAADHVAQVLKKEGAYLRCLKHDLRNRHPALQGRMLRRIIAELKGDMRGISSRHIDSLLRLLRNDGPGRSVQIPGGVEVRSEYDYLLFNIKQSGALPFCYTVQALPARLSILETGQKLSFALLSRDEVADEVQCSRDSGCAHVDADEISFPLIVRSWQAGDRFHPLGMQGSKKIKDLFSDCKVPARTRQAVPLVMCGGRILWVGGMRLDERFKVTGKTENVLRIRLV